MWLCIRGPRSDTGSAIWDVGCRLPALGAGPRKLPLKGLLKRRETNKAPDPRLKFVAVTCVVSHERSAVVAYGLGLLILCYSFTVGNSGWYYK